MWTNASSKEFWQKAVSSGEIAKLGIYAAEAYGIFKVRYQYSGIFLLQGN